MNKMAARSKNRKSLIICFKSYLLLNPWANVIQTSLECCLGGSLPKWLKLFRSDKQDGRQS